MPRELKADTPAERQRVRDKVDMLADQLGLGVVDVWLDAASLGRHLRRRGIWAIHTAVAASAEGIGGILWFELPSATSDVTEVGYSTKALPAAISEKTA